MAESSHRPQASGSTLVLGVVVGAMAGASGLAWWLLREAERRRQLQRATQRIGRPDLTLSSAATVPFADPGQPQGTQTLLDSPFQDRVQQLNQAIDGVRRQLEHLQTQGGQPGR